MLQWAPSEQLQISLPVRQIWHSPTHPPHLLPPHHHQNPQLLTAKCAQHDIALINHPKQSMFNLWRAGLTRKFITCCRETACAPVSQASIYLWETSKILERQSLQQRKLMMAEPFMRNSGRQSPALPDHPAAFSWWMTCLHDFLDCTCQKDLGIFLKHICKTWIPNYLLWIRVG